MRVYKPSEIVYSPNPLDAWGDLVTTTTEILPADNPIKSVTIEHARLLLKHIDRLDSETLEKARLHGLGHVAVPLAGVLMDSDAREDIVWRSSELLAAHHWDKWGDGDGLRILDIDGTMFSYPFEDHAMRNWRKTSFEISFLTDCLQHASLLRRSNRKKFVSTKLPDLDEDMSWLGVSTFYAGQVAPQAASTMFKLASVKDASRLLGLNPYETRAVNPLVLNVYSQQELRELDLLSAARGASRLRLDEFRDTRLLNRLLFRRKSCEGGGYRFNVKFLKNTPRPVCNAVEDIGLMMEHESRMGCPGRFVSGLFESILKIMPEIYIRADQVIKSFAE